MSDEKQTIPEDIQSICREFGEIARKHDLRDFSLEFNPGFESKWGGKVHCRWEWGRHGDNANELIIQSNFFVQTKVTLKIGGND